MTRRAFVLGHGQIGSAVADNLEAAGWAVTVGAQSVGKRATRDFVILDREITDELAGAVASGFDAVVDTIAFNDRHAAQWSTLTGHFAKLAVISSTSVYADDRGRTLDEARQNGSPQFGVPISEDNLRVAPGPQTYSTCKVALEDAIAALDIPTAIVRPGAVYGVGSRSPREWWFLQKVLAGYETIPIAWNGSSRFHPVAAENLAEIVRVAIEAQGSQILNAADPTCPTVLELGRDILETMGSIAQLRPFEGPPRGFEGYTPWSIPYPMIVDTGAAERLGYRPVTNFANVVPGLCRDLVDRAALLGWDVAFPGLSVYPKGFFLS